MDFEFEKSLQKLINENKIEEGIKIAEKELEKYSDTNFSKIKGLDLLGQADELENYLERFITDLQKRISLKAVYCEMNGFSINYDLWFVDFFGFDSIGENNDLDWLADYDDENVSTELFTIKGFEEIQKIYQSHHEKKDYANEQLREAADACDYVVVLRLQELFNKAIEQGKSKNKAWAEIPIFVTAHDYELIFRKN